MDDKRVQYPQAPGEDLPEGHYQMAPAMGGWQLLEILPSLIRLPAKLRPGQREWVGGQMMRIARLYNFER
jgi:hypothetical protein